jgi:hypothetical protein
MNDTNSIPKKRNNAGCMIGALVATVAIVIGSVVIQRFLPPAQVYLSASPYNDSIDMFPVLGPSADGRYYNFPDRTRCTMITDLDYYRIDSGPPVAFYKLDCNGKVGYVHADRVSRY